MLGTLSSRCSLGPPRPTYRDVRCINTTMKFRIFLNYLFRFVLSQARKQTPFTPSSSRTERGYLSSSQDVVSKNEYRIHRNQEYIWDHLDMHGHSDPLIRHIAEMPIHSEYPTFFKAQRQGQMTMHWDHPTWSHHHVALAVLLHRLGLRGRKYERE